MTKSLYYKRLLSKIACDSDKILPITSGTKQQEDYFNFLRRNILELENSAERDGLTILILRKNSMNIIYLVGNGKVLKIEK
jgi:hypothetical protein